MLLALWICIPTWKSFIHLDPQVSSFTGSMWALDDHTQNLSNSKKQGLFHVVIDLWHKLGNKTTVIPQTQQNEHLPHLLCLTDRDGRLAPDTLLPLKSKTFAYYPLYADYIETLLKGIPKLLVSVAMVPTFFSDIFKFLPQHTSSHSSLLRPAQENYSLQALSWDTRNLLSFIVSIHLLGEIPCNLDITSLCPQIYSLL